MVIRSAAIHCAWCVAVFCGLWMNSCSPTDAGDLYQVYFDNPPLSAVAGSTVGFAIVHTQTQDLDSLLFGMQDSAMGEAPLYSPVNVYAVSDFSTHMVTFTIAGTKSLSAVGYYKHGVKRTARTTFRVTVQ